MNANTQLMVHVGAELVIIGGVTFWMNKKIAEANEKVNLLVDELAQMKETVNKQSQIIASHQNFMHQLINGGAPPPAPITPPMAPPPATPRPVKKPAVAAPPPPTRQKQPVPQPPAPPVKKKKPRRRHETDDEDEDPQTDAEVKNQADDFLHAELEKIKASRDSS